ncbi:MAG: DAK2 domain-containing protein [Ruminococcaceae bacterium]|nr:DAK2 domain-containing protein [Oscillospiraceae bacterium]
MKIVGSIYRDMVISAACCLDNNKETVNNLNVFPVPDGDTGINMSLTMSGVRGDYENFDGNLGEAAQKAANLMLRGARGNSGVILSLFFRGIAKAWKEENAADCEEVIEGFKKGVSEAYRAVMNPTEGTILTVMRVMTETAEDAVHKGIVREVPDLFHFMYKAAEETLNKTPEMLPILKQAGVVDSGGAGFLCVMEGMVKCLDGAPVKAVESASKPKENASADFSTFNTDDIKYAYCTECIVTKSEKYAGEDTADALHQFIMKLGDSVVFVDDSEIIKLHVHTNKPGKVLTEALRYGSLYTVKIENMKHQHSNLSEDKEESETEENIPEEINDGPVPIEKKYGFVTVCMGDGIHSLFSDLAADNIVSGGQTMNPSTEDIVSAVEKTPAEIVFVLPNNKNIYMVSEQASRIVDSRRVVVIETVSVPEGIAAMLSFDESASVEDNIAAMKEAVSNVTTLSSTYAVRDTEIGDTAIKAGETLGLYNGKIVCTSDERLTCIEGLLTKVNDASLVTILYGEGSNEDEANAVAEILTEKFPGAEIMVLNGGQPVYSYIISIE